MKVIPQIGNFSPRLVAFSWFPVLLTVSLLLAQLYFSLSHTASLAVMPGGASSFLRSQLAAFPIAGGWKEVFVAFWMLGSSNADHSASLRSASPLRPTVSLSFLISTPFPFFPAVVIALQVPSSPGFCLPGHSVFFSKYLTYHFSPAAHVAPVRASSTLIRYCLKMLVVPEVSKRTTRVI